MQPIHQNANWYFSLVPPPSGPLNLSLAHDPYPGVLLEVHRALWQELDQRRTLNIPSVILGHNASHLSGARETDRLRAQRSLLITGLLMTGVEIHLLCNTIIMVCFFQNNTSKYYA